MLAKKLHLHIKVTSVAGTPLTVGIPRIYRYRLEPHIIQEELALGQWAREEKTMSFASITYTNQGIEYRSSYDADVVRQLVA